MRRTRIRTPGDHQRHDLLTHLVPCKGQGISSYTQVLGVIELSSAMQPAGSSRSGREITLYIKTVMSPLFCQGSEYTTSEPENSTSLARQREQRVVDVFDNCQVIGTKMDLIGIIFCPFECGFHLVRIRCLLQGLTTHRHLPSPAF